MVSTAGFDAELAPLMDFPCVELGAGKSGGFAEAALCGEVDGGAAGASDLDSDLMGCESAGAVSAAPTGGGSDSSKVIRGTGRVTMTSSPASFESPPASARTSRSVT